MVVDEEDIKLPEGAHAEKAEAAPTGQDTCGWPNVGAEEVPGPFTVL